MLQQIRKWFLLVIAGLAISVPVSAAVDGTLGSVSSIGKVNIQYLHRAGISVKVSQDIHFPNNPANQSRVYFNLCIFNNNENGYRFRVDGSNPIYVKANYQTPTTTGHLMSFSLKSASGYRVPYRLYYYKLDGSGSHAIFHQNSSYYSGWIYEYPPFTSTSQNCSDGRVNRIYADLQYYLPTAGTYTDTLTFTVESL
jgi:hypothetical protein